LRPFVAGPIGQRGLKRCRDPSAAMQ